MAELNLSHIHDDGEGHPVGCRVDGSDVHECASHRGFAAHFGKIRKQVTFWYNSKTGRREQKPDYSGDDYGGY